MKRFMRLSPWRTMCPRECALYQLCLACNRNPRRAKSRRPADDARYQICAGCMIVVAPAAMLALGGFSRLHSAGGEGEGEGDAKAPPKLDRQGDALPEGAVNRLGTTRWRHGDAISFLAFPSDDTVLTAAQDNTARL